MMAFVIASVGATHAPRGDAVTAAYPCALVACQDMDAHDDNGAATTAAPLSVRCPDIRLSAVAGSPARYGTPEIFNSDQGSQFTSPAFTGILAAHGIRISMDGKGRWRDNVAVERLWRSVKYEEVYLHAYASVAAARTGLQRYFGFYNSRRPHTALNHRPPDAVYFASLSLPEAV